MDFNSKKWWTFIGIASVMLVGMVLGKVEYMEGLQWIMASAATWGLLDTGAKFANKGDKK